MNETLLSQSSITLFGRVVEDIIVAGSRKAAPEAPKGIVSELQEQLENRIGTKASTDTARFARIYGFSYGGTYHELLSSMLFLVHGDGVKSTAVKQPGPNTLDMPFYEDLKAWSYDHAEQTIRLDVNSGRFEQVLLGLIGSDAVSDGSSNYVSGQRVSGQRVSGQRVSGQRVSGQRLSGSRMDSD